MGKINVFFKTIEKYVQDPCNKFIIQGCETNDYISVFGVHNIIAYSEMSMN